MRKEILCSECGTRILADRGGITICYSCKNVMLVVECRWCDTWSEVTEPERTETWFCSICQKERHYRDGVVDAYFSTLNSREERNRRLLAQSRIGGAEVTSKAGREAIGGLFFIPIIIILVLAVTLLQRCIELL